MSDISFESFSSLIYRLGSPPRHKVHDPSSSTTPAKYVRPEKIFASWRNHQSAPFVPGTTKHLFRLLFPHEGSRRRYGLKETLLARELAKILGHERLKRWDSVQWEGEGGAGCLGKEVELLMRDRIPAGTRSSLTIREVDSLLDALAAASPFSQLSQPPRQAPSTAQILTQLYRDSALSAYSLAVLTQIILRDLRPLLIPLPSLPVCNPTAILRIKSTAGPAELGLVAAMKVWNGRMAELYLGGMGDLDACANALDMASGQDSVAGSSGSSRGGQAGPVVGVNVQIPKCLKGRSLHDALQEFTDSRSKLVWAETKYDGYRMQIHVELKAGVPVITIFSKSKRKSTWDRINTHSIILEALGIPCPSQLPYHTQLGARSASIKVPRQAVRRSVILEAEVIPYNEGPREGGRGPGIEEFWWLGAAGVTVEPGDPHSGGLRDRHLCLAFFDILSLDGRNLLGEIYSTRRQLLESVIRPIPGFSILCHRSPIDLSRGMPPAIAALQAAFDAACTDRDEGLVLKCADSTYGSLTRRWVKLKKDYIPNLGDCVDLVILGAGWDMDRARELRVDTSVFTTFYVGCLRNGERVRGRIEAPHFEILFRASYGPGREELEVWNNNIRHGRWGSKPFDKDDPHKRRLLGLSWTYHLPRGMVPPSILFEQPLCGEIMGAGFQKLPWTDLYEVRWPRLQKIWEPRERSWTEALSPSDLIATAHQSLGYAPPAQTPSSPENDSIRALWRSASSQAIDVLPDTPSPQRSAGGRGMQRVMSAPDLLEIKKASPPTPRHNPSPRRAAGIRAIRSSGPATPGRRLRAVLQRRDTEVDMDHLDDGDRMVFLHTPPRSSPLKRLGSPMFTLSPEKRFRPRSSNHRPHKPEAVDFGPLLMTPPPTSPVLGELDTNYEPMSSAVRGNVGATATDLPGLDGANDQRQDHGVAGKGVHPLSESREYKHVNKDGSRSFVKPLSLESRIKLAIWSARKSRFMQAGFSVAAF